MGFGCRFDTKADVSGTELRGASWTQLKPSLRKGAALKRSAFLHPDYYSQLAAVSPLAICVVGGAARGKKQLFFGGSGRGVLRCSRENTCFELVSARSCTLCSRSLVSLLDWTLLNEGKAQTVASCLAREWYTPGTQNRLGKCHEDWHNPRP